MRGFILLALGIVHSIASGSIQNGPVPILWYDFDGDVLDEPAMNSGTLGAAYDGVFVGPVTLMPFSDGLAAGFNGMGSFVIHNGDPQALNIADGDFALWATVVTTNEEPGAPGMRAVLFKEKLGSDPGYAFGVLREPDGFVVLSLADGDQSWNVISTTSVNDGLSHVIVGVRKGGMLLMFVDGCLEDVSLMPEGFGSTTANPKTLTVGGRECYSGSPTTGFNDDFIGTIDDIRVYSVAVDPRSCPADVSCDGQVNVTDLLAILGDWGQVAQPADVNIDGVVDVADLVEVLSNWGTCR